MSTFLTLDNLNGSHRHHAALDERIKFYDEWFDVLDRVDDFHDDREIVGHLDQALGGDVMLWTKAFYAALDGYCQYVMLSCEVEDGSIQGLPMPVCGFSDENADTFPWSRGYFLHAGYSAS
jgi:hypothetical protein